MKIFSRLFAGAGYRKQPLPAQADRNQNIISDILDRGRAVFPENDFGQLNFMAGPSSRLVFDGCAELGFGEKRLLFQGTGKRAITADGRYENNYDCFEASFWLMGQFREKGMAARLVSVEHPFFIADYAVSADGRRFSLTPGLPFDVTGLKVQSEIDDDQARKEWQNRAIRTFAIDLRGVPIGMLLTKENAITDYLAVHLLQREKIKLICFRFDRHVFVRNLTDLKPPKMENLFFTIDVNAVNGAQGMIRSGNDGGAKGFFDARGNYSQHLMSPAWVLTKAVTLKFSEDLLEEIGGLNISKSSDPDKISDYGWPSDKQTGTSSVSKENAHTKRPSDESIKRLKDRIDTRYKPDPSTRISLTIISLQCNTENLSDEVLIRVLKELGFVEHGGKWAREGR